MPKNKIQKVKFHRGDKRPNNEQPSLSYVKKMKKHKKSSDKTKYKQFCIFQV